MEVLQNINVQIACWIRFCDLGFISNSIYHALCYEIKVKEVH